MIIKGDIYLLLVNDGIVQTLVKTWQKNTNTIYAIFAELLAPEWVTTDSGDLQLTVNDATVNFYRSSLFDGGSAIVDVVYTVNCRAYTMAEAEDLAEACFNALHLQRTNNGNFFNCNLLAVIPPAGSTDNYNAVVEVRARGKEYLI